MLVLEARFRPNRGDDSRFIVVGRVLWSSPADVHSVVEPAPNLPWATTLLVKLRYLVALMSPNAFERLKGLQSQFWSFVEVELDESSNRDTSRWGS